MWTGTVCYWWKNGCWYFKLKKPKLVDVWNLPINSNGMLYSLTHDAIKQLRRDITIENSNNELNTYSCCHGRWVQRCTHLRNWGCYLEQNVSILNQRNRRYNLSILHPQQHPKPNPTRTHHVELRIGIIYSVSNPQIKHQYLPEPDRNRVELVCPCINLDMVCEMKC